MLTDDVADLLELQRIDNAGDQLAHRAGSLPERAAADAARDAVAAWERRGDELRNRLAELERAIEDAEREGAELGRHRARLEGQLRTVVATREAEALMHEIATLTGRRDELDDRELAQLEEQSQAEEELAALAGQEATLREAEAAAAAALAAATAEIDGELAALASARGEVAARLDGAVLDRYTRMRVQHGGVAVARLAGTRCDGCHLDLSAAELDDVRRTPPGELADCPHCGRLLAVG